MTRKKAIETTKTWNNKELVAGATLEGVYIKKEIYDGDYGETEKYIIEAKDDTYGVFATSTLKRQFVNVPEGSYVWITFKGEQTSKKGRPVKVFEVDYDDEYVG